MSWDNLSKIASNVVKYFHKILCQSILKLVHSHWLKRGFTFYFLRLRQGSVQAKSLDISLGLLSHLLSWRGALLSHSFRSLATFFSNSCIYPFLSSFYSLSNILTPSHAISIHHSMQITANLLLFSLSLNYKHKN